MRISDWSSDVCSSDLLCAIGLPRPTIALESQMVGLCHNLFVVGFKCLHYGGEGKSFVLELEDRLDREPLDSVIHASQILDQIGEIGRASCRERVCQYV